MEDYQSSSQGSLAASAVTDGVQLGAQETTLDHEVVEGDIKLGLTVDSGEDKDALNGGEANNISQDKILPQANARGGANKEPQTPIDPASNKLMSLESSVKMMKESISFNTDRLNDLITKLQVMQATNTEDQQKTNKYLMTSQETLQTVIDDVNRQMDQKFRSNADTMKMFHNDLSALREFIQFGKSSMGGIKMLTLHVIDEMEKGPIQMIREQYAQRGAVEKEVMRLQNKMLKITEEQKELFRMRNNLGDRIKALDAVFVTKTDFDKSVKSLASTRIVAELKKQVDLCARQDLTNSLLDRLERHFNGMNKRLNTDFVTIEQVNRRFEDTTNFHEKNYAKAIDYRSLKQTCSEKFSEYNDTTMKLRKALSNHTEHITGLRDKQNLKASQKDLHEIKEKLRTFALLDDYKELYQKVVPPVVVMEEIGHRVKHDVETLKAVVEQYDVNLSTKANKSEILTVHAQLRDYVKKDVFSAHEEVTETGIFDVKCELNTLHSLFDSFQKQVPMDIHEKVRKATAHLRDNRPSSGPNIDNLLIEAQAEQMGSTTVTLRQSKVKAPKSIKPKKTDAIEHVKQSLLEILNEKASLDDLAELKQEKTNKEDTDMQMKSIDILHKQLLQLSTVILELIKQGITSKLLSDTEKQQRQKFLLQQQGYVIDWIQSFDPENVNSKNLVMPKELRTLHEYSSKLVNQLPEFLDSTVNHRLKQVGQKNTTTTNSYKNLSMSIDASKTARSTMNRDFQWSTLTSPTNGVAAAGMPHQLNLGENLPRIGSKLAQLSPRLSKKRQINEINLNPMDASDGSGEGGHDERLTTLYGNMGAGSETRTDRNFPQSKTQLLSMIRNADKRKMKDVSQKTQSKLRSTTTDRMMMNVGKSHLMPLTTRNDFNKNPIVIPDLDKDVFYNQDFLRPVLDHNSARGSSMNVTGMIDNSAPVTRQFDGDISSVQPLDDQQSSLLLNQASYGDIKAIVVDHPKILKTTATEMISVKKFKS